MANSPSANALAHERRRERSATLALLLATVFWGCGFTWAKVAGETVNQMTDAGPGGILGPTWVLAIRFTAAGVLWLAVFPESRRNWSLSALLRSLILGTLLCTGMVIQHIGLDRTTEAVSAFLTSLTILFVPLILTLAPGRLRRPPAPGVWLGVLMATFGVWLLTGATTARLGPGEILGLLCAVSYSVDIIAVNALVREGRAAPGDASRLTAGQFLTVGLLTTALCLFLPHGRRAFATPQVAQLLSVPQVGINVALLALFPSICAFGLQFRFQPRIDPTRAALIYLVEPIFASLYALLATGRTLAPLALGGAALILAANFMVELWPWFPRRSADEISPAVID